MERKQKVATKNKLFVICTRLATMTFQAAAGKTHLTKAENQ
jgi:hypothetical protein